VRAHVPKNQILFATEWESGAYVLRYAPEHRSLVMLEPTLMLAHDADLFALWLRIREGREPDAAERIVKNFGARWVLCEQGEQGWELCRQALVDRRFLKVHEGPDASLFAIPAGAVAR
jgi:hypothetical protein